MTKSYIISLLCFLITSTATMISLSEVQAQTTLEFSRVLLVGDTVQIVPAGKVWKIEAIMSFNQGAVSSSCTNSGSAQDYGRGIIVNGSNKFPVSTLQTSSSGSIFSSGNATAFPYWIPAGTNIRTYCTGSQISIIEFNILP